jgi:type II secretory pathway component PulM
VFAKLKALLQRPAAYFDAEWSRMAPRERRLVGALGGAAGAALFLIVGFFVYGTISDLEEQTAASREALAAIARHRDEFVAAKSRMQTQERRIGSERPQLEADLEAAAREANIQIPQTDPLPAQPAGKHYVEHGVQVRLQSVELHALTKFLHTIETGRRLIVVTKLNVRPRPGEREKLDVNLTAVAWERVKDSAPKKRPIPAKERT